MIGVVVPALNAERFLGDALASVMQQTPAVARIIVIDDGSSDGTVRVARDAGAEVLSTPVARSGPAIAREVGVEALATPLVAFLDADDRWTPGALARQRAALEGGPGADGVLGGVVAFAYGAEAAGLQLPPQQAGAQLLGALLVRRPALDRVLDRPGVLDTAAFFVRATNRLRFVTHGETVLERRVHGENWTVTERARVHAEYLQIAREAILARRRD